MQLHVKYYVHFMHMWRLYQNICLWAHYIFILLNSLCIIFIYTLTSCWNRLGVFFISSIDDGFWRAEIYFLCVWNLLRKWFRAMSCKWNRNAVCTSRCVWHRRGRYLHLLISLFGGWNQVEGDDLRVWNCMGPAVEFGEVACVKLAWDPRPSVWCWCCNYLIKLTHIN